MGEALNVNIRPFAWPDIEAIARLHRASEQIDHGGRLCDAVLLQQRWRRPGIVPERECLVAVVQGSVIGYALRSAGEGASHCPVDGVVHPSWRRLGVGRRLFRQISDQARLAGARTLDIRVRDDEPAATAFCQALGLQAVRTWYRMWSQPLRLVPFAFPAGYSWRTFRPHHDEDTYAGIVNDTLTDHWGTGPVTVESVHYMVAQPTFEPGNILFATRGPDIVGVCAIRFLDREVGGRHFSTGHIGPVGVRAGHRGLGLAHALLAGVIRQCLRRGMQAAELDVDEANAPAIHVYRDCGFETLFRILWYRQELASG